MKKVSIILLTIVATFAVTDCSAQLLGKWSKKLEEKLEKKADEIIQRTENKADQKIDETLDKTEDRITGNGNKKSSKKGGGIFSKVGPPNAKYNFTHYMKMRTRMTGRKAKNNMTTTSRLDYGTSPDVVSVSDMQMSGGKGEMKDMHRIIFDVNKHAMYTFMEIENQKTRMGLKFNMVGIAEEEELNGQGSRYKVVSVTKTGQSKTIAGYKADAYLCKAKDNETLLWISRANGLNPYPDFYSVMNSGKVGNNKGMAIFYNSEEIKKRMMAGAMVLSYEWTDNKKGDKVYMDVLSFGKSRTNFSTTGYKSLSGF